MYMCLRVGGGMSGVSDIWNQLKNALFLLEKVLKQEMDPLRTGFKIL